MNDKTHLRNNGNKPLDGYTGEKTRECYKIPMMESEIRKS